MTVFERVLVRERRDRLTPLAMLELLATERIERGLCAGRASMAVQKEEGGQQATRANSNLR